MYRLNINKCTHPVEVCAAKTDGVAVKKGCVQPRPEKTILTGGKTVEQLYLDVPLHTPHLWFILQVTTLLERVLCLSRHVQAQQNGAQ